MLRGHKEMVDNRVSTLVTSADSKGEYDEFIKVALAQPKSDRNFNEVFTSEPLQHWTEDRFRPYKVPVHCFHHDDEAQRETFFKEWNIKELENAQQSADAQKNMADEELTEREDAEWEDFKKRRDEAIEKGEEPERQETIGETLGLDVHDPWDRRTDEEKEQDRQMREYAEAARQSGQMTTDSFSPDPRRDPNQADGKLHVVDAEGVKLNPDGTIDINSIVAAKWHQPTGPSGQSGGPGDPGVTGGQVPTQGADDNTDDTDDQPTTAPGSTVADFDLDAFDDILNSHSPNTSPPPQKPQAQGNDFFNTPGSGGGAPAAAPQHTAQDFKDKQDQNAGVFKGSDLFGDDELEVSSLPQDVQKALSNIKHTDPRVAVKDYPYNSLLDGRAIVPFAGWGNVKLDPTNPHQVTTIAATVNVKIEGTMNMGEVAAAVLTRSDINADGWIIYQRSGGKNGTSITTSVVRIRG